MAKTAILVDGGFYRKRAAHLWGKKTAEERAKELNAYCMAHLHDKDGNEERQLYRIFYYDCEPVGRRSVYHPLTKKNVDLDKSDTYTWTQTFLEELRKRRKFALRLGFLWLSKRAWTCVLVLILRHSRIRSRLIRSF
mgnify:CR=1 FL=1